MIVPYLVLRHLTPILPKDWKATVITGGALIGMIWAIAFPFFEQEMGIQQDPTQTVPIGAGLNFVLLVSHLCINRRTVKVRARQDYLVLIAALVSMGIAYLCQDDWKFCAGPHSLWQAHAVWHAGMALGIGFFYLFLRQERGRPSADSEWSERDGKKEMELMARESSASSV